MKHLSPILIFSVVVLILSACKKDPPSLNEQLEGTWNVTANGFYGQAYFEEPIIKNTVVFKSAGENKGTIWWTKYFKLFNERDTSIGTYIFNEQVRVLHIKWTKTMLAGIDESKDIGFRLYQDDLTLTYEGTHGGQVRTDTVLAVRN